jgi:hypothetical protein
MNLLFVLQVMASGSETKGIRGDVRPIQVYRSNIIPEVKDYYDILSASVMKINNHSII